MRLAITIMVILLATALALPCCAGVNQLCKVAVHVKVHSGKQSCSNLPVITGCEDIVTTYEGDNFDAFPVFYDLSEYKGFEYGVTWPAAFGSAAFTSCSDFVIGGIVNPGDGVSHSWIDCQSMSVGITGWVWLYASEAGQICVVNHPIGSEGPGIYVLDCSEGLDQPIPCSFCGGVYGASGADPCTPCTPATEATTWGAVKEMYR